MLDWRRLGKQRLECKQLLNTIRGESVGWRNHPAALMWAEHEDSLIEYSIAICTEWKARGYNDTMLPFFEEYRDAAAAVPPPWLGNERFHSAHRSNLLRKDEQFYRAFGWTEPMDLPYIWPTKDL